MAAGIPNTYGAWAMNTPVGVSTLLNLSRAVRRRVFGRADGNQWKSAAGKIIQDLDGLNRSTERDFLKVGEKLLEFRSTARQIASDMAAVSEFVSGEQGRSASLALAGVLEHSSDMDARMQQSSRAMEQVRDLSGRIRLAFAGLRHRVSVFKTLCTLTQIETSRLGNSGVDFGDLAAEVMPLSETTQSSGQGILEAAARLDQGVQSAILSGSSLKVRQLKELPTLISGVIQDLKALEERRQRAVESSARQAEQYGAVCDAIDGVVRSVQFHDITRQQIEHVTQALRELHPESKNGRKAQETLPPDARAILSVQSSQLSGAAQVFAQSFESMERDLEHIAARAQDMAQASRELMGISTDEQDSFFLRMEADFTAILKMLSACSTAQADLQSTARSLEEIIARMQGSVTEIRGIEIRIQRIAINATLRASQLGSAGEALTVIAGVMRGLALDSNTNTEDVAATLEQMCAASSCVSEGSSQEASGGHASTDEVMEKMKETVLELHSSSEASFGRVNGIAVLGARLAEDIGAVRGGLSAGVLFAEVVGRAVGELQRMGAQVGTGALKGLDGAQGQQLAQLAKNYTMQRERDVHQSVAQGSAIAIAAPVEVSKVALENGDLGDNVELF